MELEYTDRRLQQLTGCSNERGSALTVYDAIKHSDSDLYDRLKKHFHYCGSLNQRDESCIRLIRDAMREAAVEGEGLSSRVVLPSVQRARNARFIPQTVIFMSER